MSSARTSNVTAENPARSDLVWCKPDLIRDSHRSNIVERVHETAVVGHYSRNGEHKELTSYINAGAATTCGVLQFNSTAQNETVRLEVSCSKSFGAGFG